MQFTRPPPGTQVFAANVLGVLEPYDYGVPIRKVRECNRRSPKFITRIAFQDVKVKLADLAQLAAHEPLDFSSDHLHSNDIGYRKVAQAWLVTLAEYEMKNHR